MATIGSAKATLVNKIDTLTASATAKDTIYLAKALKENTTHHSFTFQGAWAATTAYALDDVVTTSGKTYICIVAHTSGASFAVGSNWSLMAEKGTDGTDLTTTLTTAGDVVYKGASALTRLAKGTASQVLTMNSGATAPEWADAAGGGKVLQVVNGYKTNYSTTSSTTFADAGLSVTITPTLATSSIMLLINFQNVWMPTAANQALWIKLLRDSTDLQNMSTTTGHSSANERIGTWSGVWIDSPSTTSSTVYKMQMKAYQTGSTIYFNYNAGQSEVATSTITAIEIGA